MHEQHATFPSAVEAFFLVFALWACEFLIGLLLLDVFGVSESSELWPLATLLGNGLLFTGLMSWKNLRYRELFNASPASSSAIFFLLVPPVLLITPALILAMGQVNELVQAQFPMGLESERQFRDMLQPGLPQLVTVCVLAPVLEEMLFRGIILRSFLQQYDRVYAILGSAVVFGFAHGNIYQLVGAVGTGLMLGWLYERSRSLIPCIALHMAFNSGTVLLASADDAALSLAWVLLLLPALRAAYMLRRCLAAPRR